MLEAIYIIGAVASVIGVLIAVRMYWHKYNVKLDKERRKGQNDSVLIAIQTIKRIISGYKRIIGTTEVNQPSYHTDLINQVHHTISLLELEDSRWKQKLNQATHVFWEKPCSGSDLERRSKEAMENLDRLLKEL